MGIEPTFKPRDEASVLSADKLTKEQQEAGHQLHQLICQMATSPEKIAEPMHKFLPRIDPKRSNRVILIDGGRGSGKTTLLITLLDIWGRVVDGDSVEELGEPLRGWADAGSPPDGTGAIIPVGLLDLHPLPPSTNLLLHMIGRFERVVEWLEGEKGDGRAERERAAWHFQGTGELESRKTWQSLLRAVAAGWDGNAQARWARLDLDAYTLELEEAERQRLNIMDTFVKFINALTKEFQQRCGFSERKKPLFVLAVDDADMNPHRSVELLDTVRMLWHPRVAFILTGDSELFVLGLIEHCLRTLREPLRRHRDQGPDGMDVPTAEQLASDIYDKVIPVGHRCVIPPIPRVKRAEFLRDTFKQIHVEPGTEPPSGPDLASYFEREPQLSEALPDRLRGLLDLRDKSLHEMRLLERERALREKILIEMRLLEQERALGEKILLEMPLVERERALREKSTLEMRLVERERALREFACSRVHAPASRIVEAIWRQTLNSSASAAHYRDLVYVDEVTGALHLRYPDPPLGLDRPSPWVVASLGMSETGPQFAILRAPRLDVTHSGRLLARPVTAALMLATDVAADQKNGRWDSPTTDLTGYEELFAATTYRSARGPEGLRVVWPVPKGYAFSFYAAFHTRWKEQVKELTAKGAGGLTRDDVDQAAMCFLRLVLYLVTPDPDSNLEDVKLEWGALATQVRRFIDQGRPRSREWALRRAGLFAAPEFGLSAGAANAWLDALADEVRQDILYEALHAARRASEPDVAKREAPEKVLRHIDEDCPGHAWAARIESKAS